MPTRLIHHNVAVAISRCCHVQVRSAEKMGTSMNARLQDFTPVVDMVRQRGSGPVRKEHPVYENHLPPCSANCAAGEDIQAWLDQAQAGKYRQAWEIIVAENPFPAVSGRVCYHPCESRCNRSEVDTAVSIHAVERYVADLALTEGWKLPAAGKATGKKVLIIGAGPSGLSAAYHLARLGHQVEIRDASPLPGGMMHFGIPSYRLPRDVLMAEIRRIEAMGVKITLNHEVKDVLAEKAEGRFDAVFVAVGAQIGKRTDVPARDAAKVFDAVRLLHDVELGQAPVLGARVVVYGGGDAAVDAARTAVRLGAEETCIVYWRDKDRMPAKAYQQDEALSEGIKIKWLTDVREIGETGTTVEIMELDADGVPQPTGRFETLTSDAVVLALGQETEANFLKSVPGIAFNPDGTIVVDRQQMTGHAGIFAGGDTIKGLKNTTAAIGAGRKAARQINGWLAGSPYKEKPRGTVVSFEDLNLPIYTDAPQRQQHQVPAADRVGQGFVETTEGLKDVEALFEAKRCLSCGNCFECDQCYAACPTQAIEKLGPGKRYAFKYELCTGCAVCFEQCPCHAIEMVPEPSIETSERQA
ncbi:MAG: NAD(P)-binding protein [Ancalomicrobiaceae bacterium]|nr:NAD(P)-binding protein [Ancalomicrobiaceae bacterium]